MNQLRSLWRSVVDVRPGEYQRTFLMTLYLLIVLFAYYILKPVSRAMFLNRFDIDNLPYLYILIAAVGGVMAFYYTKLAINVSLNAAVNAATFFFIGALVLIWYLLDFHWNWMLYVFNIFVSLFSITLVSQGWLIAANVFNSREAKRLYGILGLGAVIGAAFGGSFTAIAVKVLGSRNLVLASAGMVALSYLAFLGITRSKGVSLSGAKGAEKEESFSARDVGTAIGRYRHLQIIIAIIALTYIVDVMVEYQFSAMAKERFGGDQLTAFLGSFYGLWLNLATFFLQFFLTAFVVNRFGVAGALQIMPVTISIASIATFLLPGVYSTGAARLTEAATRYSFNRTGMELLYLPLPIELRNRTKAFTDIFVDRLSRGMGGLILVLLTSILSLHVRELALVVLALCGGWMYLSFRAKNEYIQTVRKRLSSRRFDFDSLRINVREAGTIRILEETLISGTPRQISYALSLLSEAPNYPLDPLLEKLSSNASPDVRAKVYELARNTGLKSLYDTALADIRSSRAGDETPVIQPSVEYALAVSEDACELANRLLTHPNRKVALCALEALAEHPKTASAVITAEWISSHATSPDSTKRALAAAGLRLAQQPDLPALQKLIRDSDPEVARTACKSAAVVKDRSLVDPLLYLLPNSRLRGVAIDTLAEFGERIAGTLGDVLLDRSLPLPVRKQIPRVLARITHQRSVDILLVGLNEEDLTIRSAVLKGLNSLREVAPKLSYGLDSLQNQIMTEVRYYYQMHASLSPFRNHQDGNASRMLAKTLESRLNSSLERLFRLLGLRYPQREINAAFLAVNRKKSDEYTAAVDFLDNVLDRELKRFLLPLLEEDARISQSGRELFGFESRDAETSLRELMRSGDSWLVACAIATAAELKLGGLRADIAALGENTGREIELVVRSAMAYLP